MKETEKDEEQSKEKRQGRAHNPGTRIATDADRARLLMQDGSKNSKANEMYVAAHQEQYKNRDLPAALAIYREIIAAHPESKEAGYSRGQIRSIASKVVPQQELLDAQLDLALSYLASQS